MTRACRVCGCTDDRACETPTGPCFWIDDSLGSATVCIHAGLTTAAERLAVPEVRSVCDGLVVRGLLEADGAGGFIFTAAGEAAIAAYDREAEARVHG